MLTHVFSAGIAGALFGGFLFGLHGRPHRAATDRCWRPRYRSACSRCCCRRRTATGSSSSIRFLNGLALGGALPLIWALSIEYVATRYRATIITLIMLGYSAGVASAGPISVALAPEFGWRAMFVFGGAASLLSAARTAISPLPESLRFLATRPHDNHRMARIVRKLDPDRDVPDNARFTMSGNPAEARGRWWDVRALFKGPLRWVTPLLWVGFAASSMTTYFFTTWGPLVFESAGIHPRDRRATPNR